MGNTSKDNTNQSKTDTNQSKTDTNQSKPNTNGEFKMAGDWDAQSKELKGKFSQLTDSDLKFEPGKENDLLKRVETRLNKKRDEVINIIKKVQPAKA